MTLSEITKIMGELETSMQQFVIACGGFRRMDDEQELIHDSMCEQWDMLKSKRDKLKKS